VPSAGATGAERDPVTRPRPGHADLAGAAKFERDDLRDVLERASARETAARVAAGAVARQLLARVGIAIHSHVTAIGEHALPGGADVPVAAIRGLGDDRPLHCVDAELEQRMVAAIDAARERGDTLGGAFEVVATGVMPGIGSHTQWDRKLDGRLAQALMSIPAIKAVGIGIGPRAASLPGSEVHDEIVLAENSAETTNDLALARPTNRAGGLEGGVANGQEIRVTGYMKPISTLMRPLRSVDLRTFEPTPATIERSDVCAVPAAAVVGEAMVALVLADAVIERFGADSMAALEASLAATRARLRQRFAPGRGRDGRTG